MSANMLDQPLTFATVPFIGDNIIPSGPIIRTTDHNGRVINPRRESQGGDLVMLRPEPDCNPTKDRFWFGVITWVQKYADVGYDEHRMCEIWWVYTKENLVDLCRNGKVANKKELREIMHGLPDNAAWLSNHFSEEPTDAIISIPTSGEVEKFLHLSDTHVLVMDPENHAYRIVEADEI